MIVQPVLDRRAPSDWKHVANYPMHYAIGVTTMSPVERILSIQRQYRVSYDQGQEGACVGFGESWAMSILNRKLYDARRLYAEAQLIDEWDDTPPAEGTSLRAGFDVLRTVGHWRVYSDETRPVELDEGIVANRWATNINDVRLAVAQGIPVVFGINWYQEFSSPKEWPRLDRRSNSEYYIGTSADWGGVLGGHCITCVGASDRRQAVALCNTWGFSYPFIVWMPYKAVERLLGEYGEAGVVTDR